MSGGSEWSGRDAAKDTLRERMWRRLIDSGAAVGDPTGHIPNFVNADAAAERLTQMPAWATARVVKSNPDAAQAPLRLRALRAGKIVYMAVPRLLDERCFVELTRETADAANVTLEEAATHQVALKIGRLVAFSEMQPIDIVSVGCVAVTRGGGRTGKGAGFADIELGLLRQFALVTPATSIATTVHPLQIVAETEITMRAHDSALNWIATADELIETHTAYPQPTGLVWDSIRPEQWEKIPVLRIVKK